MMTNAVIWLLGLALFRLSL